jgi:hypothetical protein
VHPHTHTYALGKFKFTEAFVEEACISLTVTDENDNRHRTVTEQISDSHRTVTEQISDNRRTVTQQLSDRRRTVKKTVI